MTSVSALDALISLGSPEKALQMRAYHKVDRQYLGVSNPDIDSIVKSVRADQSIDARIITAATLWDTNIQEPRIAAAKILTQARIRPDDTATWDEVLRWVPMFDAWAIADHAASAGSRRLVADPSRLDIVEDWTKDPNFWVRRAALVMTLPWCKQRYPSSEELDVRERVLDWAAGMVEDRQWFIQKAIAWWLRDLSKRDPIRVSAFLDQHGQAMKSFAVKEASKYLKS
jgi:3-methyladenine DNA glycosylase AlkD